MCYLLAKLMLKPLDIAEGSLRALKDGWVVVV